MEINNDHPGSFDVSGACLLHQSLRPHAGYVPVSGRARAPRWHTHRRLLRQRSWIAIRGWQAPLWQNLDDQMPAESWDVRGEPPGGLGDCDGDDIGRTGLG